MSLPTNRRARAIASTSWIAIGVAMAFSGAAVAQTTSQPATSSTGQASPTGTDQIADVVVVGARASQQSANDRKRRAKTPTDSIVADDIGSFPDRNVNEAISRIAGVALGRNDFGEGESVAIRGNGPDLTRVELDGQGVQSTYGLALGIDNGRSADMRELSADLIKSVDVVKGSTADMTEGGLGGSILIKTRTGLDFRKPYFSLRVGAEQNSLGKKWTPDINLVASRKFLDDRLGVVLNMSYRAVQTTGHTQETTTSNNRSYARLFDWDNSPDKTFQFNPDTVSGAAAAVVFNNSVGNETPLSLVTKSAAAQSKAACLATFPFLATGTDAQKTQRINEQTTCLNQWNDYTPSLIRTFMNSQEDERKSIDLRFDYRVSDNLTVFAKVNRSDRITDDQNRSRNVGGANIQVNPTGRFAVGAPANGQPASTTNPYQRVLNANAFIQQLDEPAPYQNFFLWTRDTLYPNAAPSTSNPLMGATALINAANGSTVPGTGTTIQTAPIRGIVVNVDPATVTVDANHNVTQMTLYNNSVNIDQIDNTQPSKTSYVQLGANYFGERLRVDFMAGQTKATSTRVDMRTSRNYVYGKSVVSLQPSGLWDIQTPPGYDETNPANYVIVNAPLNGTNAASNRGSTNPFGVPQPAYTVAQTPLTSNNFRLVMRPRAGESEEKTAQIDFTYDTTDLVPFFTQFKTGFKYRNQTAAAWGGGSTTIRDPKGTYSTALTYDQNVAAGWIPPIIVPGANVTGNLRACVETNDSRLINDGITGTPTPAHPDADPALGRCNYGFVQDTDFRNVRSGTDTLTPAELQSLITATLEENGMIPFDGYPGSGNMSGWQGIRTGDLFQQLGSGQFANLDCIKRCTANDGNVYDQSVQRSDETIMNLYYMADFEQENLPFGMTFNGNVGLRGVRAEVLGTGTMQLNITRLVTPGDPVLGTPDIIDSSVFRQNVTIKNQTTDWLPSYNLNLWMVPDQLVLRYYTAKTVSRPPISRLLPAGTCNIDDRVEESDVDDSDPGAAFNTCSGRIGNPALSPYTSRNRSIGLEWYPNRDTTFGLTWQKQNVLIGSPQALQARGRLFSGTGQIDPVSGDSIDNILFDYPSYTDGPGFERTGWEFTAKTAFTFLPWLFRYTGADYNESTLSSSAQADPTLDPVTGDVMKPLNESDYFRNISIWYDDGRTNARISYQGRGAQFTCITPCSGNTDQTNPPGTNLTRNNLPYNPGSPRFVDESKFIDAKISHNLTPNLQIFLEGRNLTKEGQTVSNGKYEPFADGTPKVFKVAYSGRRVATGFTFKFQ